MLFIKEENKAYLFPLTQKIMFKQVFQENTSFDGENAIKNTFLMMKNRKIKPESSKKGKKGEKDGKEEGKESEGSGSFP